MVQEIRLVWPFFPPTTHGIERKKSCSRQKYFAFQWLSKRKLFNASSLVELLWFDLQ